MAMLRTVQWTDYVSPFDILPRDHEVLVGEVNSEQLQQVIAVKIFQIEVDNLEHEAMRLNNRRLALQTWDLPSDLCDVVVTGSRAWFGETKDDKSEKEKKAKTGMRATTSPFSKGPASMRAAYALARSDIEWDTRWSLIIGSMTAYFYDHPDISKPVLDDVALWSALALAPGTPTALDAVSALWPYEHGKDSRWPYNDMVKTEYSKLFKSRMLDRALKTRSNSRPKK